MSLYTVFSLSSSTEPEVVRFVGITSQTLAKRLVDMMSAASREGHRAYSTVLSEWLRSLDGPPLIKTYCQESNRTLAGEKYRYVLNRYIRKGTLLNSRPGRVPGRLRTEPTAEELGGRPTEKTSENAVKHARRKERALKKT